MPIVIKVPTVIINQHNHPKMTYYTFSNTGDYFQGKQGKYYIIDNEKYDIHFPYDWARNHKQNPVNGMPSGPKDCDNCRKFGSINGVFVTYCADCFETYKGERGLCILTGIEMANEETIWSALPYMRGVPKNEIGDVVSLETDLHNNENDFVYENHTLRRTNANEPLSIDVNINYENENDDDDEAMLWKRRREQYRAFSEKLRNSGSRTASESDTDNDEY